MKKEINRSVRLDDRTDRYIQSVCADLDCSFSELVRSSILLASPLLLRGPALMRLTLDDFQCDTSQE
jgi:hypothetical protein